MSPRLLFFLVPGYLQLQARRTKARGDGLAMIRQVWTSFVLGLLMIGVVSVIVAPTLAATSAVPWLLVLVVVTIGELIAEGWVLSRPLGCDSLVALASSFRSRFFLAIAFSQSIALMGFVATMVSGQWWLYWLALPFSAIGHLRVAPTRSKLEGLQDTLRDRGCALSLVRALRSPVEGG